MNLKTVVPLSAATVLGLVAAIVAAQLVRQRPTVIVDGVAKPSVDLADVVVAARDIAPGTVLTAADLTVARFEAKSAPADAPRNPQAIVNRVARFQVPRGQIIYPTVLAEPGVNGGLASVIPAGMRAITLEINEFTGVAGMIEPGDRVDLLARMKEEGSEGGEMTRTVVQNVQVLAIGQTLTHSKAVSESANNPNAAKPEEGTLPGSKLQNLARSMTLLVSPEDAERLDLAMGQNPTMTMRLALRSPTDKEETTTPGATMASLRSKDGQSLDAGDAKLAGAKQPGNDPFGNTGEKSSAFKQKPNTRNVTVIRAGVPTVVEVDEPVAPAATMSSAGE